MSLITRIAYVPNYKDRLTLIVKHKRTLYFGTNGYNLQVVNLSIDIIYCQVECTNTFILKMHYQV